MKYFHSHAVGLILTLCAGSTVSADEGAGPLVLSQDGRTRYAIVIAADAHEAEAYAAKELAYFLKKMTGAAFEVRRDDTPPSEHEIVVGHTNRRSLGELPPSLRTDNFEGFTIVRDGERLLIMGNIPRGTVYGVYDFLDVELGVRFLAHHVNHVPRKPTLEVAMMSRVYGPPMERRTIWEGWVMGDATVRNRMNGISFQILNEKMLGGVKMVGRPTHTFASFVPQEKYFSEHPEYFAYIDGKRRDTYKGVITQLCLTNPDVLPISLGVVRSWLEGARQQNPYNKYIISVSANDSPYHCKCDKCLAVNLEEGVTQGAGGPHVRFLNAIAEVVAREFPHTSVKTMFYQSGMPQKTKPVANVIVECVTGIDWRYALDDMSRKPVRYMTGYFDKFLRTVGDGQIYVWTKHNEFGDYFIAKTFSPNPGLHHIARNLRIMTEKYRVSGMFAQNSQTPGSDFQTLRYYLLARAMWRPSIDSQVEIEEFCRLYYGPAADDVLRHIDSVHDDYPQGDRPDGVDWTYMPHADQERYIATSGAILSAAEAKVDSPDLKLRVATLRLPVWKTMLNHAFEDLNNDPEYRLTEEVRTAARRFIEVGRAVRLTHMSESYGGPNVQTERGYYVRLRKLLRHGRPVDPSDPWITDNAGLAAANLTQVKRLNLCGTNVTDEGLAHLEDLTGLEALDLRYTDVTDMGLKHLENLVNLTELQLGGMSRNAGKMITDVGINHLRKMTKLRKLALGGTKISDQALDTIKGMTGLIDLVLSQTTVTDDVMPVIASLADLEHLDLFNTRVTDQGTVHLRGLAKLRYLNLYDRPISDDAVDELTRANRALHVRLY